MKVSVERYGKRIAILIEPRFAEMFWTSFQLVPMTEDPKQKEDLYSDEFWDMCEGLGVQFRVAETHELLPIAFPGLKPAKGLRENGRIAMRGLYPLSLINRSKRAARRKRPFRWLWLKLKHARRRRARPQ